MDVSRWPGLRQGALILLAAALVAGILAMHGPLMGAVGAHGSMHAPSASGHSASSASSTATSSAAAAASAHDSTTPTGAAQAATASPVQAGYAGIGPLERAAEQLCHADGAGHDSPTSAHALACDLSVPPVNAASALGAAALVAVVVMALLTLPAGVAAGGWLRRRGPPGGQRLHLSLCVIRV